MDATVKRSVLRAVIKVVPEVVPFLDVSTVKAALGTYSQVREKYYGDVFASVYDFLDTGKRMTSFRNDMRRGMADAFVQTGDIAWIDGGSELPIDADILDWLAGQQAAEFGFIDTLFQSLKDMRKAGDVNKTAEATSRADGYTRTLDRIYNYIKVAAAKNIMLTFAGSDGKESCTDCQRYKGQRHKASWWIAHDAVPPNRNFECGGWQCEHILEDDKGNAWSYNASEV